MAAITEFGKKLRVIRADLGISQNDMAKQLGYSSTYISAIELGKTPISTSNELISKICKAYKLTSKVKDELRVALCKSRDKVCIDISKASKGDVDIIVGFAIKFEKLSKEDKERMVELLGLRKDG